MSISMNGEKRSATGFPGPELLIPEYFTYKSFKPKTWRDLLPMIPKDRVEGGTTLLVG